MSNFKIIALPCEDHWMLMISSWVLANLGWLMLALSLAFCCCSHSSDYLLFSPSLLEIQSILWPNKEFCMQNWGGNKTWQKMGRISWRMQSIINHLSHLTWFIAVPQATLPMHISRCCSVVFSWQHSIAKRGLNRQHPQVYLYTIKHCLLLSCRSQSREGGE